MPAQHHRRTASLLRQRQRGGPQAAMATAKVGVHAAATQRMHSRRRACHLALRRAGSAWTCQPTTALWRPAKGVTGLRRGDHPAALPQAASAASRAASRRSCSSRRRELRSRVVGQLKARGAHASTPHGIRPRGARRFTHKSSGVRCTPAAPAMTSSNRNTHMLHHPHWRPLPASCMQGSRAAARQV